MNILRRGYEGLEARQIFRVVASLMEHWPDMLDLRVCLRVFLLNPTDDMVHGTRSRNKSYIVVLEKVRKT